MDNPIRSRTRHQRVRKKTPRVTATPDRSPALRPVPRKPFLVLLFLLVIGSGWLWFCQTKRFTEVSPQSLPAELQPDSTTLPWQRMSALLAGQLENLNDPGCLEIPHDGGSLLTLRTSLDPEYQQQVEERLSQTLSLGAAAVVLEPQSGRIVALAEFNRNPEQPQVFFWKGYPAASLVKVVTAAAAIEKGILEPYSMVSFTGSAHSLRPRDLRPEIPRWAAHVTLENAFARSLNTVFGRIGIYDLGPEVLREYGHRFYFNQAFPSEVPFDTSLLDVPPEAFGLAQVASGYNQRTLITPLHAAWIAAMIQAGGAAAPPWLIKNVEDPFDPLGPLLETSRVPVRVLSPAAARKMQQLMEATIIQGTCRRSFYGRHRSPRLCSLVFGGKTGNINDEQDTVKYDWFMGYARDLYGKQAVALCVFILHDRTLGQRANRVAFDLFNLYYAKTWNP